MKKSWSKNWRKSPGNEDEHYSGDMQPVDYFISALPEALVANIIKYAVRHPQKGKRLDLEKARWYVDGLRRSLASEPAICAGDFIASNDLEEETKEIILQLETFEIDADFDRSFEILDDVDRLLVKMIRKNYE